MSPLDHSPTFSTTAAQEIAETKFGIKGTATELPSERDQNFRITTAKRWHKYLKGRQRPGR